MSLSLLTPPAEEPLALADAKTWLRLDQDDEDDLVRALIVAARLQVEATTGRLMVSQTWRLTLDAWPCGGIVPVPLVPLASVAAATVVGDDGATTSLDLAAVTVDTASRPARLLVASRPPARRFAGIRFDLVAGYGAGADVPAVFVQAMRLLVAHWYENRTLVAAPGADAEMPRAVTAMLAPHRVARL
jgi:uncharacterized phiE125 gp8 family phage protein